MREYTIDDFKIDKAKCKYHAHGTWSIPIFDVEEQYSINYSDILTHLIFLAGRYCESYASDLFIHWSALVKKFRDRNYEGEKFLLGFREMGVDSTDWVIKNHNENSYYYRKIVTIEVVINGNNIDMYMN